MVRNLTITITMAMNTRSKTLAYKKKIDYNKLLDINYSSSYGLTLSKNFTNFLDNVVIHLSSLTSLKTIWSTNRNHKLYKYAKSEYNKSKLDFIEYIIYEIIEVAGFEAIEENQDKYVERTLELINNKNVIYVSVSVETKHLYKALKFDNEMRYFINKIEI